MALACAVLVAFSVAFIDRPVERYVATHTANNLFLEALASPSLLSLPFASLYLLFHTLRRLSGRPDIAHGNLLLTLSLAIAVGSLAKDELKWIIGRPWPFVWVKYGLYSLHPFSVGRSGAFGSFPSGHTTYIAAPMFVLWQRLPRYRLLWLGIVLLVMIGLVGSGYHFVADVIAGFFLGMAAAAGTILVGPKQESKPLF